MIEQRQTNIRIAEKQYNALQQSALGLYPEPPDKARGTGLGKEAACIDCQTSYPHLTRPFWTFGALSGGGW